MDRATTLDLFRAFPQVSWANPYVDVLRQIVANTLPDATENFLNLGTSPSQLGFIALDALLDNTSMPSTLSCFALTEDDRDEGFLRKDYMPVGCYIVAPTQNAIKDFANGDASKAGFLHLSPETLLTISQLNIDLYWVHLNHLLDKSQEVEEALRLIEEPSKERKAKIHAQLGLEEDEEGGEGGD